MFGLLKAKNTYEEKARDVYAAMLEQVRMPQFYTQYGVPDTFDGRFDLLVIHVSLIVEKMVGQDEVGQDFNQAVFDVMFADMDQTLRQMGAGDMGVPKHMRRMMKGFNGRVQAYGEAKDVGSLKEVLIRNLYGTIENPESDAVAQMCSYVVGCRAQLRNQGVQDILSGKIEFMNIEERRAA